LTCDFYRGTANKKRTANTVNLGFPLVSL
jgi:hypothetical protein